MGRWIQETLGCGSHQHLMPILLQGGVTFPQMPFNQVWGCHWPWKAGNTQWRVDCQRAEGESIGVTKGWKGHHPSQHYPRQITASYTLVWVPCQIPHTNPLSTPIHQLPPTPRALGGYIFFQRGSHYGGIWSVFIPSHNPGFFVACVNYAVISQPDVCHGSWLVTSNEGFSRVRKQWQTLTPSTTGYQLACWKPRLIIPNL